MVSILITLRRIDRVTKGWFGLALAALVVVVLAAGVARAEDVDGTIYLKAGTHGFYMIETSRHAVHYCLTVEAPEPNGIRLSCHGPWALPILSPDWRDPRDLLRELNELTGEPSSDPQGSITDRLLSTVPWGKGD